MVQRLSAMFIAESVLRRGRNPGAGEGPLSGRVACLFRSRSHQKAAFASGDFIEVRSPYEMAAK